VASPSGLEYVPVGQKWGQARNRTMHAKTTPQLKSPKVHVIQLHSRPFSKQNPNPDICCLRVFTINTKQLIP